MGQFSRFWKLHRNWKTVPKRVQSCYTAVVEIEETESKFRLQRAERIEGRCPAFHGGFRFRRLWLPVEVGLSPRGGGGSHSPAGGIGTRIAGDGLRVSDRGFS